MYSCSAFAFYVEVLPTSPSVTTPFNAATQHATTYTSSSSSDVSDSTARWIGLGIFGAGFVAFCALTWWFCLRGDSWFRKRRRQKKYLRLNLGNSQADGAPRPYGADVPTVYSGSQLPLDLVKPTPARPTPVATKWKDSESGPRTFTYRVESIPEYVSLDLVKDLFTFVDSKRVTVRSLGSAIGSNSRGLKTATIEYKSLVQGKSSPGPSLSSESEQRHIHVDSRFNGWTPLNNPRAPIQADVVAVTGLAGHAFGSWAHDHHHNWLRDYLPMDMPNLRVMTYGYDSQLGPEQLSRQDLELHAADFATKLRGLWQSTSYRRPTILVGHSLGCLLIKEALIRSAAFSERPEGLEKIVPLVIFFGAPHGGLATTALETLVKGTPSQTLIEELKPGSPFLDSLTFKFKRISLNMKILSVYERQPTASAVETSKGVWKREGPPVMMVERDRALLFWPNEDEVSSQTDHKNISKLERTEGGTYGYVLTAIATALRLPTRHLSVLSKPEYG